jgi:hypothetical protein
VSLPSANIADAYTLVKQNHRIASTNNKFPTSVTDYRCPPQRGAFQAKYTPAGAIDLRMWRWAKKSEKKAVKLGEMCD